MLEQLVFARSLQPACVLAGIGFAFFRNRVWIESDNVSGTRIRTQIKMRNEAVLGLAGLAPVKLLDQT